MTYEEVKRIRENPTAEDVDCKELQKLIDEAIEKQIPKKPNIYPEEILADEICCPNCGMRIDVFDFDESTKIKFCNDCGQALDWSEEE